MTQNVENLGPCTSCGGRLFPFILCESCGAATILREARQLEREATCPECGARNPWQVICDQCHSRFRAPAAVEERSPAAPSGEAKPTAVPPAAGRPKRRINGESDPASLVHLLKVLGLDPSRAQALIDRGYDALWKIARTSVDDLARIPEVGPVAAHKMLASLHLIKYTPPRRTKEEIAQDEYECPLCGCITSMFAPACLECGAAFDEEEMDEAIRQQFAVEGDAVLLAFYDARLVEKPEDADLLYARGLLLQTMGRTDEAMASLDRAAAAAPDERKIKVAQLRIQAKELRKPDAAEKLRSTASSLLDDVAWDQEIAQLDDLLSEEGPTCPSCGSTVPRNVALCPSCGARLVAAPSQPEQKPAPGGTPELDILVDDLLVGELEKSLSPEELELTKAAVLDWLIEELEETMGVDATIKAAVAKRDETKAATEPSPVPPAVGFLTGWMRGTKGLVSGARPKTTTRGAGKVNGLVNGRGRVNGLVNGLGRTNGLVNGVGRVNGLVTPTGRVNGLMGEQGRINGTISGTRSVRAGRKEIRVSVPAKRVRYAAIAAATLVAILIAAFLFIPIPGPTPPIVIDGAFGDWATVPMYDAVSAASDANVAIDHYASLLDHNSLYLFASTRGGMFGDSSAYDGIYFLIDADGNPATGYQFEGIGAEAVLEIFGGNNSVAGSRLYGFPSNAEVNWSQRQSIGSPPAAASVQGVEAQISTYDLTGFDSGRFRIAVLADDFAGISSRSLAPLTPNGSVLLELQPFTSVVSSTTAPLFTIRVHALGLPAGDSWDVSSFVYSATQGVTVSLSTGSVVLTQGQPETTITAFASASGPLPGDVIQVDMTNATALVPVVIRGGPIRAYMMAPPSTVRVDGLFADWVGRDQTDSDPVPVKNPDVDILRYGAAVNTTAAYFHVAVAGDLMAGRVPDRFIRIPPGQGGNASGGPPVPLPRRTGEDILRSYVDLNSTDAVGLSVDGIHADYLLEVRGVAGRITSQNLYAWTGSWSPISSSGVALAKNATDIEGSIAIGPTTNTTRMVFEATDWSSGSDWTVGIGAPAFAPSSQFVIGTRSLDPPRTTGFGGTLYLRDAGPSIPPGDCSAVKGLSTAEGGLGVPLNLSGGSAPCFFTDPESSPETIYAGEWSASLDLSTSTGTVLNITFAVTESDGTSPAPICFWNQSTTGGTDQTFSCPGGNVSLAASQRIRLRIEFVSGLPIVLSYDGTLAAQDSSIIVPVPEFGDFLGPIIISGVLVLVLSSRRRRSTE
ncbi:MAG TPA: helix-hairpin-helix domain-containing protein [Thermoplasmata archaeon]|nr:helix-hairpin-helix domain-containing protein [Thermoplasmata archaeon]